MRLALVLATLLLTACNQGTGGALVAFSADAVGTPEAASFVTPKGYAVTLSKAQFFVGALYLNQANPSNYSLQTACLLPGIYSGEVRGSVTVDALSAEPQPFDATGNGTSALSLAAELWQAEGDVNADDSKKVVLALEGEAAADGGTWPFEARFTIGKNRTQPPLNPALYGTNPICKQRIISPIPTELNLAEGGTLRLTVDPRAWFTSVDFAELTPSTADPTRFEFLNDSAAAGQPDTALYNAMRSTRGPYALQFIPTQ